MSNRFVFILRVVALLALFSFFGCSSDPNRGSTSTPPDAGEPGSVTLSETPEIHLSQESLGQATIPSVNSLVPFNSSWHYPQLLNRRPGDALLSKVNPPRFSWPLLKDVLADDPYNKPIPAGVYTFQIATDDAFSDIIFEVKDTPYNFYNALPSFDSGTYFWRVGYGAAPKQDWSGTWSFRVDESSVAWDRTVINSAVELLSERERPRSGPPNGNWDDYNTWLQSTEATQKHYGDLVANADRVLELPWWNSLPKTDKIEYTDRNSRTKWIGYLKDAVSVAFVYRLTGDSKYSDSIKNILHMAKWERGGGLSPEALGGSTKMPSQAPELFAAVYDWFYDDLSRSNRRILANAVKWRLDIMYNDPGSIIWRRGDGITPNFGMSYAFGSHPYQNYTWTIPAILLMAGDCEVADSLVPLALHYLTGVTTPEGPEEGYNEGHGYSNEKGGTMLKAALVTDLLLPELEIGKNPLIEGFVDWMIFMFPGAERLPWGDSWLTTARGVGGSNLRYVAYLTGSEKAQIMWDERGAGAVADNVRNLYSRPWFDLLAYGKYRSKLKEPENGLTEETLFLPEAGWIFTQSQPIQTFGDYYETIGMQMQMRPKGGYSHSFPSDGAFTWYAYGQLLTCGGGWRSWASLDYSRDPISQNTLLVNGRGHESVNRYSPAAPYQARPLAFEEGEGYTYWSADLTPGYHTIDGIERVHRHFVFVDKKYFVIFDDMKLEDSADPAHLSWLFHIYQNTPVTIDQDTASFSYRLGSVFARVAFANKPETLAIENRILKDAYKNPFTGHDSYPVDMKRAEGRGIFKKFLTYPLNHNALWVSTSAPTKEHHFLSVLTAKKGEDAHMPELKFEGESKVTLALEGGIERSVSFDPSLEADIMIDLNLVRSHFEMTSR